MTVRRVLAWLAIAAVLLGVFTLYARPTVLVMLADQVWSCFH